MRIRSAPTACGGVLVLAAVALGARVRSSSSAGSAAARARAAEPAPQPVDWEGLVGEPRPDVARRPALARRARRCRRSRTASPRPAASSSDRQQRTVDAGGARGAAALRLAHGPSRARRSSRTFKYARVLNGFAGAARPARDRAARAGDGGRRASIRCGPRIPADGLVARARAATFAPGAGTAAGRRPARVRRPRRDDRAARHGRRRARSRTCAAASSAGIDVVDGERRRAGGGAARTTAASSSATGRSSRGSSSAPAGPARPRRASRPAPRSLPIRVAGWQRDATRRAGPSTRAPTR